MKLFLSVAILLCSTHVLFAEDETTDCGGPALPGCTNGLLFDVKPCPCESDCCPGDNSQDCADVQKSDGIADSTPDSKCVKTRKKRFVDEILSRQKRNGAAKKLQEKLWWRCDFPCEACCRTCRRSVPFITPIPRPGSSTVYPVYCPSSGGYQLIDQIACLPQKCKKECEKRITLASYLVTTTPPDPVTGHCDSPILPVFFYQINVYTHCICPKEGKKCGKPIKGPGKGK